MRLGPLAHARGVRLLTLDEVDSTNDEARRLIESGERGPLWVVAARQTKGRGRLGREWISPPGNFHGSFVVGDFAQARIAPQLGFVAGVAAIKALRACSPSGRFALKWPNDLLLDGAKLGGILLECVNATAAPVAIVGIGVNVAQAPPDLPYPARALAELGAGAPSAGTLFERLSDSMTETVEIWRAGEGFADIRDAWLAAAGGLGEEVRVALAHETLAGRFETIDADGRLVLSLADGQRRAIEAGDVLLGPRPVAEGPRA